MKLYEINRAMTQIIESANPETGEIDEQAFNALALAKEDKQKNIVIFINQLDNDNEVIKKEIERLEGMKKRTESAKEWLTGYLKKSMEADGINELNFTTFKAKIQKNPPKVIIHNEEKLYERFGKMETIVKIDKQALKEALKNNEEIEGAELLQETRLVIK